MASARLSVDLALPRIFQCGADETATLTVYRGSEVAHPTSGTYTLKDDGGTEIVSGAVTIDTEGVASFAVGGAFTLDLDYSEIWMEEWALLIDGKIEMIQCDAMNVRRKLYNVATQKSLLDLHPQIVNEHLPPERADFGYALDAAFDRFQRDLIDKGNRPHLILSPWVCLPCVRAAALAQIFNDAITTAAGDVDRFEKLRDDYRAEYHKRFPKLTYKVDGNQDGTVSGESQHAEPVMFLSSTPRARRTGLSE